MRETRILCAELADDSRCKGIRHAGQMYKIYLRGTKMTADHRALDDIGRWPLGTAAEPTIVALGITGPREVQDTDLPHKYWKFWATGWALNYWQ